MNKDPKTRAEWHEAAILAKMLLRVDAARQYGLITGGPKIDFQRCEQIVHRAATRGIVPTEREVAAAFGDLLEELNTASVEQAKPKAKT